MTKNELFEASGRVENPNDTGNSKILCKPVSVREYETGMLAHVVEYQEGSDEGDAFVIGIHHYHWLPLTALKINE